MDPNQIFATGGISGASAVGMYLIYRFFFSKHRIKSVCCGKEISIDVDASTPTKTNINPMVDDASIKTTNQTG